MKNLDNWYDKLCKRYDELKGLLEVKGYTVYAPDFPGFGSEPLGKIALEFKDYVNFVKELIQKRMNHLNSLDRDIKEMSEYRGVLLADIERLKNYPSQEEKIK